MPLPKPGQTITVPESAYMYGAGPLTTKVISIETRRIENKGIAFLRVYGWLDQGQYREPIEHWWLVSYAALDKLG